MNRRKERLFGESPLGAGEKTIRIPVRIRNDGNIEYFYGGELPEMREGTIGDLVVPEWSVADQSEVARLQQEHVVSLPDSGSEVLFAVDGRQTPAELRQHLKKVTAWGPKKSHAGEGIIDAVEVILDKTPLQLRLRGTKPAKLQGVSCSIPSLDMKARSLNHAYRLVSEHFEPKRISHSGNVFELAYVNSGGRWVSLGHRRDATEATFEMLFSRTAAKVFERLPEALGSGLRECWGRVLPTKAMMQDDFGRWQSKSRKARGESDRVGVQAISKLMDRMLTSISATTSYENIRLIHAAVTYLLREGDKEDDSEFRMRSDDELRVVRVIAEETGLGSPDRS